VTTTRSTRPFGSPNVRVSVVTPFAVSVVITEPSDAVRVSDVPEAFVFVTFTFDAFVFATTVEFELFALEVSEF
jgi:hypothetical protein